MVGDEDIKVKGTWGGARPNTGGVRAGAGRWEKAYYSYDRF